MKFHKLIIFILIVFLKTGNVLSDNNIFNVNNIELKKEGKVTNALLLPFRTGIKTLIIQPRILIRNIKEIFSNRKKFNRIF